MTLAQIVALDQKNYMNTFGARTPIAFSYGKGIHLYSTEGQPFVDFFSGIAVNCVGHSHPRLVSALKDQVEKLLHTSSLYYVENQAILAEVLTARSCADKVFLCNSGAEANEGAIKLARIYFYRKGAPRKKIVTLNKSFHGRTLATVAATGQEKYQQPYQPLTPEFVHIDANDMVQLEQIDTHTAAVMIEVLQCEGGIHELSGEYLRALRARCDETGALLIIDEVQTGIGRTGKLFGYEHSGIEPDIFTLAKGLGGGVPIGAVCAKEHVAQAFQPGDHGTTFGGGPLVCRAAIEVLKIIEDEKLIENASSLGAYFINQLKAISSDEIKQIRGLGLIIGIEFNRLTAKSVCEHMFKQGYLVGTAGESVLRILPPLITQKEDIDKFISKFKEVLLGLS